MTSATAPLVKPLSMAECCTYSLPTLLTSKTSYPFVSLHSKPIKLSFSSSSSTSLFPSFVSLKHKISQSILVPCVAQTSDWNQKEEEEGSPVNGLKWGDQEATVGVEEREEGFGDGGVSSEGEESYTEPPEEAKLFVGNLPYDVDSEKLAQLFDQAGVVEIAEVIYNRETDRSRGFGFVTMSTVDEAEKAVETFNGYDLNGRLLTVNKAAPRGSRPEREPRSERSPRVFEPSFRIYVGNLPWQMDNDRLEQVFSEHGKVVDARVVYDRESGRSRGFGFVTMSSETELNDAIAALDGQSLDGRAIRVNVAEERPRRAAF